MTNTELRNQGVDRAYLFSFSAACVAQIGCLNMVLPVGHQQGQCGEVLNDLLVCFWSRESLQQFLQDKSGSID
jgi:hypothetical protein